MNYSEQMFAEFQQEHPLCEMRLLGPSQDENGLLTYYVVEVKLAQKWVRLFGRWPYQDATWWHSTYCGLEAKTEIFAITYEGILRAVGVPVGRGRWDA